MTGAYVSHAAVELQSVSQLRRGATDGTEREKESEPDSTKPWTQRKRKKKTALREEELRSRGGEIES